MTHEEVLIFTRVAADRVRATPMDRCEATDGAPRSMSKADGLFRVPLEGAERGYLVQFLAVTYQADLRTGDS